MTRLAWPDEFKVGHEQLDNEHRLFVDLINTIYSGAGFSWLRATLNSLLDDIYHLAEQHFRHENAILSNINRRPIPSIVEQSSFIRDMVKAAVDEHLASHAQELPRLRLIIQNMRGALDAKEPYLGPDLVDWFITHVTQYDQHLRPIFAALSPTMKSSVFKPDGT